MNEEAVKGLRALADFLATYPYPVHHDLRVDLFARDNETFKEMVLALGDSEKRAHSNYIWFAKDFSKTVSLHVNRERNAICERIVTGKRIVKKPITEVVRVEEVEEEIVEWKCPDSILRACDEVPAELA